MPSSRFSVGIAFVVIALNRLLNTSGVQRALITNRAIGFVFDILDQLGMHRPWVSSEWLKSGEVQGLFNPEPPHLSLLQASLRDERAYFEGWYYKIVSENLETLALIPVVVASKGPQSDVHCAIIVADPNNPNQAKRASYHRFEISDCTLVDSTDFEIRMGENVFRRDSMSVQIPDVLVGSVNLRAITPWPATLLCPTCMGFFAHIPGMQCNHGVVSLDHILNGTLRVGHGGGARDVVFDHGRGYLEKDWGFQFPRNWVWVQCNHFYDFPKNGTFMAGTSMFLSIAHIPFPGDGWTIPNMVEFQGFLGGLWHAEEQRLFRFGTFTLAQVSLDFPRGNTGPDAGEVVITVVDSHVKLVVHARDDRRNGVPLWGPVEGKMVQFVHEMLNAHVNVTLSRNSDETIIFQGYGLAGGLEIQYQP